MAGLSFRPRPWHAADVTLCSGVALSSGTATCTLTGDQLPAVGSYTVTATYVPDTTTFSGSSGTVGVTVAAAAPVATGRGTTDVRGFVTRSEV
jgi:hypothetical protein